MQVFLSPYELAGGSAAAAFAIVLSNEAAGVLTIRPEPAVERDAEALGRLLTAAPWFARLLDSWRWCGPLWRTGALRPMTDGTALAGAMRTAASKLRADRALRGLARFLDQPEETSDERFLNAVARELVGAGNDPAIGLPMMTILEESAGRSGGALVLGDSAGAVWKPRRGAETRGSFSIPIPEANDAEGLLEIAGALAAERSALNLAVEEAFRDRPPAASSSALHDAASMYESAFEEEWARMESGRRGGARVVVTLVASQVGASAREASARLSAVAGHEPEPARSPDVSLADRPLGLSILRVKKSAWDTAGASRASRPENQAEIGRIKAVRPPGLRR